jgi:2-methylcitrate dehydratase PrpD
VTMKVASDFSVGERGFSLEGPEAARVIIERKDKQILSKTVQHAKGGTQDPLSWDDLVNKFRQCTVPILTNSVIDQIIKTVLKIESLTNVSEWMKLLQLSR